MIALVLTNLFLHILLAVSFVTMIFNKKTNEKTGVSG